MLNILELTTITEEEERICDHLTARLLKEGYIYKDADKNSRTDFNRLARKEIGEYVGTILHHCGKALTVNTVQSVAYVTQREDFESYADIKCDKNQTLIALRLYQEYNMQQSKVSLTTKTIVKLEDLQAILRNVDKRDLKLPKLTDYLLDLQKYNLIKVDAPSRSAIDSETNIIVYPSIACFMNMAEMEHVEELIDKLHKDGTKEEKTYGDPVDENGTDQLALY